MAGVPQTDLVSPPLSRHCQPQTRGSLSPEGAVGVCLRSRWRVARVCVRRASLNPRSARRARAETTRVWSRERARVDWSSFDPCRASRCVITHIPTVGSDRNARTSCVCPRGGLAPRRVGGRRRAVALGAAVPHALGGARGGRRGRLGGVPRRPRGTDTSGTTAPQRTTDHSNTRAAPRRRPRRRHHHHPRRQLRACGGRRRRR